MGKPSRGTDRRGHRMNVVSSLDACQPRLKLRFWGSDMIQGLKERSGIPLLLHPLLRQNPHQPPHDPSVGQPCPHEPQRTPFLHAFPHIPLHRDKLGIPQTKLVIQASPGFSSACGVSWNAHSSLNPGQVSSRYHRGRVEVNANLEPSGTPAHELDTVLTVAMAVPTSLGTLFIRFILREVHFAEKRLGSV